MMLRIRETNILDMIDLYGEEECRIILSSFSCPLGKDVEDFISHKAIEFAKQRIAMTFLVFHERDEQLSMVGYYTLANKFVSVSGHMLSISPKSKSLSARSQSKAFKSIRQYLAEPCISEAIINFIKVPLIFLLRPRLRKREFRFLFYF